jgi:iron complex outermembrane receptor protein
VTLDGVFIGSNTNALLNSFDVERLEILRGPQGVLFGRNTTAGLISIIRTRPERGQDFSLRTSADFGSYGQRDGRAVVLAPIGDRAAFKLSGYALKDDGYYKNTFLDRDAGGRDIKSGLIGLALWPTDNLDLWVSYERLEDQSDLGATRNMASTPGLGLPCAFGDCFNESLTSENLRDIQSDRVPISDAVLDALTFEANLDAGPGVLTYVFGLRDSDEFRVTDADASRFPILWFEREQTEKQTSHELRFFTDAIPRTALTLGVFYFEQEIENTTRNRDLFPFLGSIGATGPLSFSPDFYTGSNQVQETTAQAVFASVDYALTEQLTLNLGGRYSNEEKSFRARDALPLSQFGGFGTIFLQVAPGVRVPFPGAGYGAFVSGDDSWGEFTPRVGLQYEIDERKMVYASYSRGFKSGGYNIRYDTTVPGAAAGVPSYDPETVSTYEAGFKSELFDRRLRLNGAVYYNDYQDKQEQVIAPNPATGGLTSITIISNASAVKGMGAEFELQAVVSEELTISASGGYNDIEYDSFSADIDRDFNATSVVITDNSDLKLVRAPEFTLSLRGDYVRPIGAGELRANASYRYVDEYFLDIRNDPRGRVKPFGTLDANIGYGVDVLGGRASATLFGRNLTDETRLNSFFQIATVSALGGVNRPRVFGVELRYEY